MRIPRLLLSLSAILFGSLSASAQFAIQDYVPMKMIQTESPVFPSSVYPLGLTSGEAQVAIQIDDTGQLTDYVIAAYSHPAFGDAAVAALKKWQFKPALIHGVPRSATADLVFDFKVGTVVVDLTVFSITELIRFKMFPDAMSFSACSLGQLDRIPTPIKIVRPEYPQSLARNKKTIRITVGFYIDELGRVRLPAVSPAMNESNEELCAAVVTAVGQWRFEPPILGGKPTLVLAQQDFDFKPATR
jgi:TonB family protein